MKKIFFILAFIPNLVFSQYLSNEFTFNDAEDQNIILLGSYLSKGDSIFDLSETFNDKITGLFVSGSVTFANDKDSYVRIIMKDVNNTEFLVYEAYPLLLDNLKFHFSKIGLETACLPYVQPLSLRIETKKALIDVDSLYYSINDGLLDECIKRSVANRRSQCHYIANLLNERLTNENKTWRAGITFISQLTFEEKKSLFGGQVPELYGLEFYKGGIFVVPNGLETNVKKNSKLTMPTTQYVNEWDWRNRHGKNWMTSIKNQGGCGSCGAFSALGALEAYINLYYNQNLDYDLSEEELISCISSFDCQTQGMTQGTALTYVQNNGIVTESCFPYVAYEKDCNQKCQNPSEVIYVNGYETINYSAGENYIKSKLLHAPLPFGIYSWIHALVLVGYKTIQEGDVIQIGTHTAITINANDHNDLIGKTAWLLKNSWGTNWGNQGYAYVYTDITNLKWMYAINGNISSMILSDSDIVYSDADGDGLYFWGIGPKPTNCPSWVPDTPDGDDSNINFGSLDSFGNLDVLPAGITIDNPVTYSSNSSTFYRLGIVNGGSLTITGTTTLTGDSRIRVCEGGVLIIDGGTLQNADIVMVPGSRLIIRNNGVINMATGKNFEAPTGVTVSIENGKIN